jgi:hypothetical protein|tara:strand:+ start:15785 stop:15976 length:192 start_codon:yes stop_codon:yes gene_type:complete
MTNLIISALTISISSGLIAIVLSSLFAYWEYKKEKYDDTFFFVSVALVAIAITSISIHIITTI